MLLDEFGIGIWVGESFSPLLFEGTYDVLTSRNRLFVFQLTTTTTTTLSRKKNTRV